MKKYLLFSTRLQRLMFGGGFRFHFLGPVCYLSLGPWASRLSTLFGAARRGQKGAMGSAAEGGNENPEGGNQAKSAARRIIILLKAQQIYFFKNLQLQHVIKLFHKNIAMFLFLKYSSVWLNVDDISLFKH